jgi:hypothetical protein
MARHRPITAGRQHRDDDDGGGRRHDPTFPGWRRMFHRGQRGQVGRSGGEVEPVQPILHIHGTAVALPTKAFAEDSPLFGRETGRAGRAQALRARFDGGAFGERVPSRQQHVGNACECEEVVPRIGRLTFEQLAARIARSGDGITLRPADLRRLLIPE